jgi:hypothetical protein
MNGLDGTMAEDGEQERGFTKGWDCYDKAERVYF